MAIGRNDPCPCGSGKKYKKCCYKKDQIERRVAERLRDVDDILQPDATIYRIWYEWRKAKELSDFNFLYDLIVSESPLAERFRDRSGFVAACTEGSDDIPTGKPATFRHLTIFDSKTAKLLQTIGDNDPTTTVMRCECIDLVNTERGWRLSELEIREVSKAEDTEISLALFDDGEVTGSNHGVAEARRSHGEAGRIRGVTTRSRRH